MGRGEIFSGGLEIFFSDNEIFCRWGRGGEGVNILWLGGGGG